MSAAIIGTDGFIGGRLAELLPGAIHTTHKPRETDGRWPFDLRDFGPLPKADVIYVCAGINGQMKCEGRPESHHVNVDAKIRLAKHYLDIGGFMVFLTSRSLEWSASVYSRQHALLEAVLITMPVAIVRAGRVTSANITNLCETMIAIGEGRISGLTVWGTDDISYDK